MDKICDGCRRLDGEHAFDETCTLTECVWCDSTGFVLGHTLCRTCGGTGRNELFEAKRGESDG